MIDKSIIEETAEVLIKANKDRAIEIVKNYLSDGGSPLELMEEGFIPGINATGDLFGRGRLFLPELIQAAEIMKVVTDMVNETLSGGINAKQEKGTVLIATVQGDVHDIGKCIVVSLMQANGFKVHDAGRDVATQQIIETAIEIDADIIGTSALLTTTMPRQKDLEVVLKSEGLKDRFKTVVGGAPVTPRWAARIGADAYAKNAQDGVEKIKELLSVE
ncbi:MAG: dimethylamine corrinoid protein 3 [Deltaproteobacteria bacterium]|nr:MAG: dimethylamine corrinoid protein 3 [Deltaproteobacteria bacterium]RLC16691.1 MAG: dimethylamine corrinoid protein 3 [Deltaproteobacteria bacterium]